MNRKLLVALMSGALVLPMGAQGVDIEASGHINRALVFHDMDDDSVDPEHVDAGSSPSRFRFKGSADMDGGLTAGMHLEYGAGGDKPDDGARWSPTVRFMDVSLGGEFGTVTLGQTAPATHLIGHVSYAGAAFLSGTELGCDFCLGDDAGPTFGGGAHAYGASRRPVVKYDSPSLGVANLSFSGDGNDFWDAALRASGAAGALGYKFQVGFTNYPGSTADATPESNQTVRGTDLAMLLEGEGLTADDAGVMAHETMHGVTLDRVTDTDGFTDRDLFNKHSPMVAGAVTGETEVVTVAAAVEFGQGTFIDVAWVSRDRDGADTKEMNHFGVGHNAGNTSVAATFTSSDMGSGGDSWGLGIGHVLGEVELYAGYKNLDFDPNDVEDFGMFIIGSRVKFN